MEKRIFKHILVLSLLAGLLLTATSLGQSAFDIRWGQQQTYMNSPANTLKQWAEGMEGRIGGSGGGKGDIYYVDSEVSSEGDGSSFSNAKDTIEEAYDLCTANNGDTVHVAQGHAETLGTLVLDTEGVTIIGYGSGEDRPEITWDTTSDIITVSAASNVIKNLSFRAGVHATEIAINITADGDYTVIWGCDFPEPSTNTFDFKTAIQLTTAADNVTVAYCTYKHADAVGPVEFIDGGAGAVQGLAVVGNYLYSEFSTAAIFSDQTDLEVLIADNVITVMTTNEYAISMGASATGWLIGNKVATDTYATGIEAGGLAVDESTVWVDYGQTDTVAVPYFPNATGVARMSATEAAEIEAEAEDALEADHLDHLAAVTIADEIVNQSFLADITSKSATSDWSTFVNTTDSLEAISDKITALEGVNFQATATGAGATSTFISTDGGDGFGDDYFNTGWSLIIVYDAGAVGAAPEGDIRDIVDYASTTGTFTVAPVMGAASATGDKAIVVRHEDLNPNDVTALGGSGRILYVDAGQPGTPDVGDIGDMWDLGYTTIATAIAGATASNGDVIYVAAGHTETIADAQLAWNVAGVRIIGRGVGSTMPIINFNHANASVDVTAADIYVEGIRFRVTEDDVLVGIDIAGTGDGLHLKNCIFDADTATDEFLETIEFKAAAAANVTIEGCEFYADDTADATEAIISEVGVSDNTKIIDNTFIGSWVVSAVYFSQAHTNMLVKGNTIQNFQTGQHSFESTAASTGLFANNTMHGDTIGAILDPGSLMCTGNLGSISINEAGVTLPLSADTTGVTAAVDGSNLERLEWLQLRSDEVLGSLGRDTVADNVFYVDSVAANGGSGVSWATSEDTLKAAIDDVTSNVDSIIFFAANHTEEFTASVAVDAPGVTIIGLGQGAARPVFTFNNLAAALTHTVADVRYENVVFQNTTADSTVGISLNASSDGAKFTNCEWLSTGAFEFLSAVTLASGCDDVEFYGCKFNNLTAGVGDATAAITNTAGVTDGMVVDGCEFYGTWSIAAIISDDADTDVVVKNNIARNAEPGAFAIEFTSTALGSCVDNMVYTDSYGIGLDPGSMGCFGNLHSYAAGIAAIDTPLIAGKTYTLMANQASITATTDPLFAIAGGPILITNFFGRATATIGASDLLIQGVDTETSTAFPYTTSVTCDSDAVGTSYTFTGAVASVLTPVTGGNTNLSDGAALQWYAVAGTIDQLGDAAVVGVIDWYMTFIPLAPGVVVTDDS